MSITGLAETAGSDGGVPLSEAESVVLGARICAAAGVVARSECALVELVGEFDAGRAWGWWQGVKSVAHWLAWSCSMAPGTAREHVRVARAVRQMPTVLAAFRAGRLSYSKVREVTRLVGVIDEARLCELALTATASQLGRMLAGYRSASGRRIRGEEEREFRWSERDSQMVDVRIRLPKEEAAVVLAAVNAAKDHHDTPPAGADSPRDAVGDGSTADDSTVVDASPGYRLVDAVVDLARDYLAVVPGDRSGEDRATVVVHVAADHLAGGDVPAGTPPHPTSTVPAPPRTASEPTCQVQGLGGVEPETGRRMACDNDLLGAVVDAHGDVLALGRTRRLVSRPLRRALMIRDQGMCQYPGCHQTRHLKAHHIVHWADGGPTDLDNLILLCQFHHTTVHEGHLTITRRPTRAHETGTTTDATVAGVPSQRWDFRLPDGTHPQPWWTSDHLTRHLARHTEHHPDRHHPDDSAVRIDAVDHWDHPDAARIRPGWNGEPFDLHACVEALFSIELPTNTHHLAA